LFTINTEPVGQEMKRFLHVSVFLLAMSISAIAFAPVMNARPYDYNWVCSMRAAGHEDMWIEQTIQNDNLNVSFLEIEQFVAAAERQHCPQYFGKPSWTGPPQLPGE
jgi:hypothetical protein